MEDFIIYQTFSNIQEASHLIDLLETNQIPFEIDDSAMLFDIAAKNINPIEDGIIIKIRAIDVEKVDEINSENTKTDSFDDHYLYSFSDNDIMDIIINPEGWTEEEVTLAKEIAKQRDLKPKVELVKSVQKKENTDKITEQAKQKALRNTANWFLWIAIFSILNTISIIFRSNFHFSIGLGINDFIVGVAYGFQQAAGTDIMMFAIILSFLVSAFFLWIWTESKKKNQKIYLMGTIIYGIDTLMSILSILVASSTNWWWFGIALRLFILWMLYMGYKTLLISKKTKLETED